MNSLRVLLGLPSLFIDTDKLFAASRVFSKAIVSDSIEPRREARFSSETADVSVGANKSFLSKIIGESDVRARKLAQQTTHARLMPTNQLAKSVLVVIDKNSSNEVRIG